MQSLELIWRETYKLLCFIFLFLKLSLQTKQQENGYSEILPSYNVDLSVYFRPIKEAE